jgi:hypothetical protein
MRILILIILPQPKLFIAQEKIIFIHEILQQMKSISIALVFLLVAAALGLKMTVNRE